MMAFQSAGGASVVLKISIVNLFDMVLHFSPVKICATIQPIMKLYSIVQWCRMPISSAIPMMYRR